MEFKNEIDLSYTDCASGASFKTASAHAVTLEQYVNAKGTYLSADVAVHNVTAIKQKTRNIPASESWDSRPLKIKEITVTTSDGQHIMFKLFMDQ